MVSTLESSQWCPSAFRTFDLKGKQNGIKNPSLVKGLFYCFTRKLCWQWSSRCWRDSSELEFWSEEAIGILFYPTIFFFSLKFLCVYAQSLQSYPTLCNPVDCNLAASCVHGILQARILEWIAMPSPRGSSQPRDWIWVSCIAGWFFTAEPLGDPNRNIVDI